MKLIGRSVCACGAITVYGDDGTDYSTKRPELLPKKYKQLKKYQNTVACNYCVNNWGLELCGCGSGELFGECENGYPECAVPMQVLSQYQYVPATDAWV